MVKTKALKFKFLRGGLSLLLCAACTIGINPSQSEAAKLPEVGPTFLAEQEQKSTSRVRRLSEFNDRTDAVGYLNQDGSKTLYIYANDVRYRDDNGRMVDKNIHLAEATQQEQAADGYRYRTAANDITAYYPERLSDSDVQWEYNGHRIALRPQSVSTSAVELEEDGTSAVYQTASGNISFDSMLNGTILRQTVSSDDATTVTMTADFGDLTPTLEQNSISLLDASGEEQLRLEGLSLTDQEGNTSGDLALTLAETTDGEYTLSVALDEEFLSATESTTASLNTSITVPSSTGITGASVYEEEAATTHASSVYHHIGSVPQLGIAYTFVNFNLNALSGIRYDNITSACYRFEEETETAVTTVMEAYFVRNLWTESTITWNNMPGYYGNNIISKTNINYDANETTWYDLYITKAVQGWLQGLPNYGILLKEKDDGNWRKIFSDDSSMSPPCLVVTYVDEAEPTQAPGVNNGDTYYLLNKKSGKYLAAAGTTAGSYVTEDDSAAIARKVWTIELQSNGCYILKNNDLVLRATGAVSGVSVKIQSLSSTDPRQYWKIIRNWDGSYQLMNYSGESSNLCLSGGSSTNGTNTSLAVHTVDHNAADDWTLVPTEKGKASFFYDTEFSTDSDVLALLRQMISIQTSSLNNMGYSSTRYDDKTGAWGLTRLQQDAIWYATSHGDLSAQWIGPNNVSGYLSPTHIQNLRSSSSSQHLFDQLQLAILGGCSAGANSTDPDANLVGLIYRYGAHNVLGCSMTALFPHRDYWVLNLFTSFSVGYNLGESKEFADAYLYENYDASTNYGNFNALHDLGDNSYRFDLPNYSTVSTNSASTLSTVSLGETSLNAFLGEENTLLTENDSLYNVVETSTNLGQEAYSVYKDASGNAYIVQTDTDILETYLPNTSDLDLGNAIVDAQTALQQAEEFLASAGYDVTNFVMTHSNEYSKRFEVVYRYYVDDVGTTEKLFLYFESEEDGTVHLTRFAVYDYGTFSASNDSVINTANYAELLLSIEQTAAVKAAGNDYTLSAPVWYRNDNGNVQLRASMIVRGDDGTITYDEVYSTLLQ